MNQIICISEKIYRASQWVKDKYKRPTTTVVSFENENGGFRVESTRQFFLHKAQRLPPVFHAANCIWWQQSETASFIFFRQ